MKLRLEISIVALLLNVTPSVSQPYDDPAVLACEELAKSSLLDRAKYTRQEAMVTGSTVSLRYQVQIMTAAPETRTLSCPFKLNTKSGYFNYSVPGNTSKDDAEHGRVTIIMMKTGVYPIQQNKTALR